MMAQRAPSGHVTGWVMRQKTREVMRANVEGGAALLYQPDGHADEIRQSRSPGLDLP